MPPIGDMACAASPMHSRPGRYQRLSRSTITVSNFTSSQVASAESRSRSNGATERDLVPERLEPTCAEFVVRPLRNEERALPVVAPVDHHEKASVVHSTERLRTVVWPFLDPDPQDVHRRAQRLDLELRADADDGRAPVGADDEVGTDLAHVATLADLHAGDAIALDDEVDDLGLGDDVKRREGSSSLDEKIEEVPLRHEGHERTLHRQAREVRERELLAADLTVDLAIFGVRPREERVEQAEFVQHFESRGVNRVAAEVAKKVRVLLEHPDVDAGAAQQVAQHHARRATAGNHTRRARRKSINHGDHGEERSP